MSDEQLIRELLLARTGDIGRKDARAGLSYYSADIVNFDLAPPLAQRGREATDPEDLQKWFDTWDGPIGLRFDQLQVRASQDIGFAFGFLHLTGKRTDGSATDAWLRFTACLQRQSAKWVIVHEHQSFPMLMDGSEKAATDLQP